MIETFFKRPSILKRLSEGPGGSALDQFASYLTDRGIREEVRLSTFEVLAISIIGENHRKFYRKVLMRVR